MNIYIVTEGITESIVYKSWIPQINPLLTAVKTIAEVDEHKFLIVSSMGYPFYFETIANAVADVNSSQKFNRLVITVDSEEMSREDKHEEVASFIRLQRCDSDVRIVVQHFCFEAWAYRKIIRTNPENKRLKRYKDLFDVRQQDPELLPPLSEENLNRAQFAEKYLRLALNDRYPTLSYSKSNPKTITHAKYFEQVSLRASSTDHIASFNALLKAFD